MEKEALDVGIISILATLKCTKEFHNKGLFRTQIAKLLYLTEKNTKNKVGYKFKDDHFGPYDRKIEVDLEYVKSTGLVHEDTMDESERILCTKHKYQITAKGEKKLEEAMKNPQFEKHFKSIQKICEKYGNLSTHDLLELVYKKHYKKIDELENDISELRSNLKKIFTILDCKSEQKPSPILERLLIMIEYSKYVLRKLDVVESRTQQNIMVQQIKILFEEISSFVDDFEKINCLDEFQSIFAYLNQNAKENDIPTYDDENLELDDFLDEDDMQCLLKNTVPAS